MGTIDIRREVREFLSSRRARISPEQAGLLAGVSIDYYIRMEGGNLSGASEGILDSLASALQLDHAEREHLFALARESGPPIATETAAVAAGVEGNMTSDCPPKGAYFGRL